MMILESGLLPWVTLYVCINYEIDQLALQSTWVVNSAVE